MAKATTQYQVTMPKRIADAFEILSRQSQLQVFDEATVRHLGRSVNVVAVDNARDRGWSREDLYDRGKGVPVK